MNWYKKAQEYYFVAPNEMKKILALVEKIKSGNTEWTAEELELQMNYPKIVEKFLSMELA